MGPESLCFLVIRLSAHAWVCAAGSLFIVVLILKSYVLVLETLSWQWCYCQDLFKQVCIQLPTSSVNVALPASGRCCSAAAAACQPCRNPSIGLRHSPVSYCWLQVLLWFLCSRLKVSYFCVISLMIGYRSHGGIWCRHWSVYSGSCHSTPWCYCWSLDRCKSLVCLEAHHTSVSVCLSVTTKHVGSGLNNQNIEKS